MVERVQNKILRKRKRRVSLLTYILKVLKDDPTMSLIFLQELLDSEDSGDESSSVELATKLRIFALQDSQEPWDPWWSKNKDKRKEPRKVMTLGKNKAHYLNKIFFTGKGKTIDKHCSLPSPNISLFIYSPDKPLFMNSMHEQIFQKLLSVKQLPFDNTTLLSVREKWR